jgi:hypothetical protein
MPTPVTAGPVGETQSRMILGLGMIGWSESEMHGANEHSSNASGAQWRSQDRVLRQACT